MLKSCNLKNFLPEKNWKMWLIQIKRNSLYSLRVTLHDLLSTGSIILSIILLERTFSSLLRYFSQPIQVYFFLVDFKDASFKKQFDAALLLLSQEGIGGDRSSGKGRFTIEKNSEISLTYLHKPMALCCFPCITRQKMSLTF